MCAEPRAGSPDTGSDAPYVDVRICHCASRLPRSASVRGVPLSSHVIVSVQSRPQSMVRVDWPGEYRAARPSTVSATWSRGDPVGFAAAEMYKAWSWGPDGAEPKLTSARCAGRLTEMLRRW